MENSPEIKDLEERLQKAYKIYRGSLLTEPRACRAYRRGISRYSGELLESLKQAWLKEKDQHLENTKALYGLYEQKYPNLKCSHPWRSQKINCVYCERLFHPRVWNDKYCNRWCAHTMRKKNMIEKYFQQRKAQCNTCSKEFVGRRSDMKFCSNACRQRAYRNKQ